MTKDHSQDGFVQVHLHLDCDCYVPTVDADGMLAFRTAFPTGDRFVDFKVWVPEEVTKTKTALIDYVRQCQESSAAEFVSLDNADIWVEEPDHEDGGHFAFS